jgi:hypothetical protein
MVTPTRVDTTIIESHVILRGLHSKGVTVFGPFESFQEAFNYGDHYFPHDTWEIVPMIKEE